MSAVVQSIVYGNLEVRVYDDGTVKAVQRQGQWVVVLDGTTYEAVNPDPAVPVDPFEPDFARTCNARFYRMRPGQYGEPLVEQEPTHGVPVPSGLSYVDANRNPAAPDPRMHIHGIVCCEPRNPTPVYRGSFSNFVKLGIPYAVNADGTVTVNGETWYIHALANADQGRILGYFVVAGRTPVQSIRVRELGNMSYLLLQ